MNADENTHRFPEKPMTVTLKVEKAEIDGYYTVFLQTGKEEEALFVPPLTIPPNTTAMVRMNQEDEDYSIETESNSSYGMVIQGGVVFVATIIENNDGTFQIDGSYLRCGESPSTLFLAFSEVLALGESKIIFTGNKK